MPTFSRLLLFALLLFVISPANAVTYYVSQSEGSDTFDGLSPASPWQSLARVEQALTAKNVGSGDAVLFKRGDIWDGMLNITNGGSPEKRLIFGTYGSHPNLPRINATGQTVGIQISGQANISMFGLWVSDAAFRNINIDGGASNMLIQDCFVRGAENGIRISGGNNSNITLRRVLVRGAKDGIWVGNYSTFTNLFLDNVDSGFNSGNGFVAAHGSGQGVGLLLKRCRFIGNVGNGAMFRGFDSVNLVGCDSHANAGHGYAFYNQATGIIVQGVAAYDNSQNGIQFSQDSTRASESIQNVVVFACAFGRNGVDGMAFRGNGSSARVESTRAFQNNNDGFNVKDQWAGLVFGSCRAELNGMDGIGSDGDGFSFHNTSSGVIISSYAFNNAKSAAAHVDGSSVTMANNLFVTQFGGTWPLVHLSGAGSFKMWHNTVYTGIQQGINIRVLNSAVADIRNNIVYGAATGIYNFAGTVSEDRNIFFNMSDVYNGVTPGAGSMYADPLFTDLETFDFVPQIGSPALDAAIWVNILSDHRGQQRVDYPGVPDTGSGAITCADIGAFERP